MDWDFTGENLEDTDRFGAALAACLPDPFVVGLNGTLGAGKTRLVQALGVACGIDAELINSPTFVLVQHYEGTRLIHHIDAYRIADDDEFLELGVDELFENGICIIEWSDRVEDCLPDEALRIEIEVIDESRRQFRLSSETLGDDWLGTFKQHLGQ